MKNDVEQARASNMEDDESSAPNKGKVIDVGSDSDIDKDINNLSASNKGKDTASTSSISNPELKIEITSRILEQLHDKMEGMTSQQDRPNHFERRMMFDIREDLILLENQLPFSIIRDIYQEINRDLQDATWESFLDLVTYVFGKHTGDIATFHFEKHKFSQVAETRQIVKGSKHFTDLLRSFMLKGSIERRYSFNPIKLKYSAVMLRKAGVKFQVTQDKCLVNIKFEKGVLKIPRLEVDHSFERLVRNIMALEQCCYQREAYVCSYIKFMDHLIDSAEDVGLLVRKGIILHWLGDDAALSNMINKFCENIGDNYSCFGHISRKINSHYESRFNHTKASLKLIYFANIWRGTATVAAAILLILTFIQTISSVKLLF
ncbi:hypothetical protein H0E87_028690 [Populus deltoides]|uniref:Uncharacterized protein n=1 Tax=Populus deltoides TaxID=3696 RepID=A0A8T2WSL8_POPDE|nr:hypothetical protein H0E87_028690 [Populus deltoides]